MRIEEALIAERARYIHSNMLAIIFANLIGGSTTAALFWGIVGPVFFAVWLGFFAVAALYWAFIYWTLRRASFTPDTAQRLFRLVLGWGSAVSLAWGIGFYFFYPAGTSAQQSAMFSSVMLFGISAAICFASNYPAFLGTFLPFALSVIVILAIQPSIFYARLITVCLFTPLMALFAWRFNRLLVKSLELRFENVDLVAQLRAQKEVAEKANRAKSVFLAKVSHELRTPMHAVLGYLDLALREQIGPAVARQLNTARMAGKQLVSQINDLLDYARVEHALLKLDPSSTALHALAVHLKERIGLLAPERGNRFELVLEPNLPHWVWVDGRRLDQALMALLTNAMRYTRGGEVRLRIGLGSVAQQAGPLADGVAIRFEVEDTGRGIASDALARIFNTFERGDSTDVDGMGLGLPIAQHILGLMGSRLEVESQVGRGSRFGFTLVVRVADESQAMLVPQSERFTGYQGRTRQVLVLDDNPINRRYLEELLGDLGFDVRSFATASTAMAYLATPGAAPEAGPDLCIVDQHLEELETGWDFIVALRGLPSTVGRCAVLVLSATEALPPLGRPLERGMDRHLLKPVKQQLLLQTVGELIGLQWTASTEPQTAAADFHTVAGAISAPQAWRDLIEVADSGALSALDDWLRSHPALGAQDRQFQRLLQTLDFVGIADHAKSQALVSIAP